MMGLDVAWLGCDLVSGQIIEELPELRPWGPLRRLLGEDQSMQFTMPIPAPGTFGAPPVNWEAATEIGRTMIVCVLNGSPVWAGIVLVRQGGTSSLITFGTVTCEGYLDHRFVGDHKWTQQDEASVIAVGLLKDANDLEGIGLIIDAPPTGKKRDREYFSKDNKSVKSAMQELAGVIDGIEWTVDLEWKDATQTSILKIVRIRKRIGVVSSSSSIPTYTVGPAAVFDTLGESSAKYEYQQDYSSGHGANHIVAWSSGEGEDQPFSAPARDEELLDSGMPRWEERFQPSTSISSIATLNTHAQERLALIGRGITAVTIVARADAYPRLGQDWFIGDDLGFELVGHWHRDGLIGQARAVGWELEPQLETVTPILLAPAGGFLVPGTPNWIENPTFEVSTAGWVAGGTVQPTLTRTAVRSHSGSWSLLVAWNIGTVTNLLSANTSSMETSAAGWPRVYNCTVARSTAQAAVGSASLIMTGTMVDTGFGIMLAGTPDGISGVPIIGGRSYEATGQFRAGSTGRLVRCNVYAFDENGIKVGASTSVLNATDNSTDWVTKTDVRLDAPINAHFATVEVRAGYPGTNVPAVGEVHYADDIHFHEYAGGSYPSVTAALDNVVPGQRYNCSAWVWVPFGSAPVQIAIAGLGTGSPSSVFATWQQITYSFVATSTNHSFQIWPAQTILGGETVYLDDVEVTAAA
jgi:hypothetical protein